MSDREGRRVGEGSLRGHYKKGRVYTPPLMAFPQSALSDWVRDDLPDLLWPLVLAELIGDDSLEVIAQVQRRVLGIEPSVEWSDGAAVDGRLSSLEQIPAAFRPGIRDDLRRDGLLGRAFPVELRAVLALYGDPPGGWLALDDDTRLDDAPAEPVDLLAQAIMAAIASDERNALVKAHGSRWLFARNKLHMEPKMADILGKYPTDAATRPLAESMLRAAFLSSKATDEHQLPTLVADRLAWAKSFWAQNWHLTPCRLGGPVAPWEVTESAKRLDEAQAAVAPALAEADQLYADFVHVAFGRDAPLINLHRPARHEVVCGLVVRAYRSVRALLEAPHRWSGEHGGDTSGSSWSP